MLLEAADRCRRQPLPEVTVGNRLHDADELRRTRLQAREEHEQEGRAGDRGAGAEEHRNQRTPLRPVSEPSGDGTHPGQGDDDQGETGQKEAANRAAHA